MDLAFQAALGEAFRSPSQKIRNLSEHWMGQQMYCPNCGQFRIERYRNNKPVADFFCQTCKEDYELKSQQQEIGGTVLDGAYGTMIERLRSDNNPNLFLLRYDKICLSVIDLVIIPKHFFIPEVIIKKRALSANARRAGWVGCLISVGSIPHAGRIYLVKNRTVEPRTDVLAKWQQTLFLREQTDLRAKSWLLSVMNCIEKIRRRTFTIDEVYRFEGQLKLLYPQNQHIKAKIRQQLQVLRDKGYLAFVSRGAYRLAVSIGD